MLNELDIEKLSQIHDLHLWQFEYPWFHFNICEQVSVTEFKIQKWWADRIDVFGKEVNILNSGLGAYSLPFCMEKGASHIRLIDMDPITAEISNISNKSSSCSHMLMDISFDYEDIPESDIYINTSCEHSYHIKKALPKDKLCVLSGCDLTKRGHINLIHSCDNLIEQSQLSTVIQTDKLVFLHEDELGVRKYNQYFVIGKK